MSISGVLYFSRSSTFCQPPSPSSTYPSNGSCRAAYLSIIRNMITLSLSSEMHFQVILMQQYMKSTQIHQSKCCGLHSKWRRGFIPRHFGSLQCRQGRVIWNFLGCFSASYSRRWVHGTQHISQSSGIVTPPSPQTTSSGNVPFPSCHLEYVMTRIVGRQKAFRLQLRTNIY